MTFLIGCSFKMLSLLLRAIEASGGVSFVFQFMVVTVLGVFGVLVRSRAVVALVPDLARATILRLNITEITA